MGCRRRHFRVLELDGETVSVIYLRVCDPFDFVQATGDGRTVRAWNAIDTGSSNPPTILAGTAHDHPWPTERCSDEFGP